MSGRLTIVVETSNKEFIGHPLRQGTKTSVVTIKPLEGSRVTLPTARVRESGFKLVFPVVKLRFECLGSHINI